ncbi:MAG: M3 family oligoendopeptidase [Phycisphaeraceae bacterium]
MTASTAAYLPADLDPMQFDQLQPLYQELVDRPINSPAELERWLLDYSALSAVVSECGARCSIDKSCHTDDAEIEKRYLHFVENVAPKIKPFGFALEKKYLASPHRQALPDEKYHVMAREWREEVELFRQENIPLQTRITKLASEYDKVMGAMLVEFAGKEHTLQQLARFSEEPQRATRQAAWEAAEARRAQDRQKIDGLFDQMLALRNDVAGNADCADYRAYIWKSNCRFDYTPQDCHDFADAIEATCLPLVEKLNRRRQADLGVATLRPWDLAVDPRNRPPLKPFAPEAIDRFLAGTAQVFERISPVLGQRFRELEPGRNLDLDSRKGKRPGGYQASLAVARQPFIFMNAAGLHRDVETLLHEGGHAFHYQAARQEPLLFVQHAPLEFCEVASMSMELLGDAHMDVFYDPADAARAVRSHLEGIIRFFPWMATIDQFQHWLYTHSGHNSSDRQKAWLEIYGRFSSKLVDWSGYESERQWFWQRQIHLFHHPFYYVEYGIAQLGALQVWLNYQLDAQRSLQDLLDAFALGGARRLPELFQTAGIRLDFSRETLVPLMQRLGEELERLPDGK